MLKLYGYAQEFQVSKVGDICVAAMNGASNVSGFYTGEFKMEATVSGIITDNIWKVDGSISNDSSPKI